MPVVNHMLTHPVRECHMARNEAQIIAPLQKARGLGLFSGIEEANGETIQMVRRRSGPHLSGWHRIAAQQKMPSLALSFESAPYRPLHHSMSPCDLPFRSASKHTQLEYLENVGELRLDQLADCGLAHPASAGDEKKHIFGLQSESG